MGRASSKLKQLPDETIAANNRCQEERISSSSTIKDATTVSSVTTIPSDGEHGYNFVATDCCFIEAGDAIGGLIRGDCSAFGCADSPKVAVGCGGCGPATATNGKFPPTAYDQRRQLSRRRPTADDKLLIDAPATAADQLAGVTVQRCYWCLDTDATGEVADRFNDCHHCRCCCCCSCRRRLTKTTDTSTAAADAVGDNNSTKWQLAHWLKPDNSSIGSGSRERGDGLAAANGADAVGGSARLERPTPTPGKIATGRRSASNLNIRSEHSKKRSLIAAATSRGGLCEDIKSVKGSDGADSSKVFEALKPLTLSEEKVNACGSSLIESAATVAVAAGCRADELTRQCQQPKPLQQRTDTDRSSSSFHASGQQNQNNNNISGGVDEPDDDARPNKSRQHANGESKELIGNNCQQLATEKTTKTTTADNEDTSLGVTGKSENNKLEQRETNTNGGDSLKLGAQDTSSACATTKDHQQQQQQQQSEGRVSVDGGASDGCGCAGGHYQYIDWNLLTSKYRKMPPPRHHHSAHHPGSNLCWQLQSSCLYRFFTLFLQTLFPIFTSFRGYHWPGDLLTDLIAGSTVAVLHIPQGMAYGLLAGVDPIYGLYVSFVPVLVMALMSRSRHVSYGTFAILSMMLANACDLAKLTLNQQLQPPIRSTTTTTSIEDELPVTLVNNHQGERLLSSVAAGEQQAAAAPASSLSNSPHQDWFLSSLLTSSFSGPEPPPMPSNIEILTCICLLVGLIQVTMSLLRLGILSLMFSDQLVSSFTAASAFHVITSQVPNLFDLATPPVPGGLFKVCRTWWALIMRLSDGFNYYTALLSLASICFLLVIKELVEPMIRRRLFKQLTCLPSELFLMACIILSSWYWKFEQNLEIEVIGHVPTDLPAPKAPRIELVPIVLQDALTIALVSFAMNLSLGQVYAKRNKYQLNPNQELFALGTSNVVGSFFSCFPCASSLSRSAVQSSLNVKSQVCSLFSCTIVVLIICYFAPILHDLPKSTLSCIIVVALKGILFQVRDLYDNWRLSKLDAIVWITTFMSVLAFGVTYGLVLGIAASLFMVFVRLLNPNHSILGQLAGTEIYVDRNAFVDCHEIDQVKIFRFNSALCYLNRTMFKACIEKSLPLIYKRKSLSSFYTNLSDDTSSYDKNSNIDTDKIKFLVIDCSALAYCDYSGAETLVDIVEELEEFKVQVYLAACPVKLINMIEKMKRTRVLQHNVHPTITDALNHAKYLRSRQMQQCSMSNCTADVCTCLHSVIDGLP